MRIWQVPPRHPRFRALAFADWETRCRTIGPRLALADYAPVWEEPDPPAVDPGYLEDCFRRFQADHLPGYRGRSLSVSDVVEAGGRFYYCDAIGFVDITDCIDR
jgi:hypothetical protein